MSLDPRRNRPPAFRKVAVSTTTAATTLPPPGGPLGSRDARLSIDEEEVIRLIRLTPFGSVTVRLRNAAITEIRREETIRPPSQQLELPGEAMPADN